MKRYSETVLNGHPDKFCDLIADRLIRELYKKDPGAYAQIEVAAWSDVIFLNGGSVTNTPANLKVRDIIIELGKEIGYTNDNYIDVEKYKIMDHVCWITGNPKRWTDYSNDQCIVSGYAGYDEKTNYLPPEHFLSWYFRDVLTESITTGKLKGQGPDGKILITMLEEYDQWKPDTILVTLQQKESASFLDLVSMMDEVLQTAWNDLRRKDERWKANWNEIRVLINPNGPLLNGGSDGDNGQTGRKLVMDYYGPRIPIGGGALYGKDLSHVDRLSAFNARRFAVNMVRDGAKEAFIRICYAPGVDSPLSIDITSDKRPRLDPADYFGFTSMLQRHDIADLSYTMEQLGTFYNKNLTFNSPRKLESHIVA